jgi:protoporphyrinogen oxidase
VVRPLRARGQARLALGPVAGQQLVDPAAVHAVGPGQLRHSAALTKVGLHQVATHVHGDLPRLGVSDVLTFEAEGEGGVRSERPPASGQRGASPRATWICQAASVPKVIILGGGLAGLVCAKALAEQELDVELWEASDRFGGKAGSIRHNGRWVDHGFHIFPAWYLNTQALLDELDVELWEGKDFYEVFARDRDGKQRRGPRGKPIRYNRLSRTLVASIDMISRPRWYLDDLSVDGFLRARPYAGRTAGERLREISRKALASPAYLTSSLSMRSNLKWWMPVVKKPNWNALTGPLQTRFIEPLVEATRRAGANLFLNRKLIGIEFRNDRLVPVAAGHRPGTDDEGAIVVSALPVEVLKEVARNNPVALEQIIRHDRKLKDIQYLDARPLAALDLHLKKRLRELPRGHFILRDSRYDLTGIDITNVWDDYRAGDKTVLQLCAGDTTEIKWLEDDVFRDRLIEEVRQYFPFAYEDVDLDHTCALKHHDAPLFMNEVGSNSKRVRPDGTGVPSLYIVGDHTDTPVDLACMEGAVYSALMAAEAICTRLGIDGPKPKQLRGVSGPMVVLFKIVRYPLGWAAIPLRLVTEPYYRIRKNQRQQLKRQETPGESSD